MSRGIKRLLRLAQDNVNDTIWRQTDPTNLYSRGMSREGYNGGYCDALSDVTLALNGVLPNRNGWWEKSIQPKGRRK